jgi:hypothetical protein
VFADREDHPTARPRELGGQLDPGRGRTHDQYATVGQAQGERLALARRAASSAWARNLRPPNGARERLFGAGNARLFDVHPGARYRDPAALVA